MKGGVLLLGSNFAPTDFLWCAFSMPPAEVVTARGPWRWTRGAYVNSSAILCAVPQGYEGDWQVAATHDDVLYGNTTAQITYYDAARRAHVDAAQRLAMDFRRSGYLRVDEKGKIGYIDAAAQVAPPPPLHASSSRLLCARLLPSTPPLISTSPHLLSSPSPPLLSSASQLLFTRQIAIFGSNFAPLDRQHLLCRFGATEVLSQLLCR